MTVVHYIRIIQLRYYDCPVTDRHCQWLEYYYCVRCFYGRLIAKMKLSTVVKLFVASVICECSSRYFFK